MRAEAPRAVTPATITGRIVSGVIVSLLLLDAVGKLAEVAPVVEGTMRLGYPAHLVFAIGLVELLCVVAYAYPPSAIVGAVLLTGYLGGAVATHVRMESPLWTHVFSPLYAAAFVWGGLLLRDERLRALFPISRSAVTGQARRVSSMSS